MAFFTFKRVLSILIILCILFSLSICVNAKENVTNELTFDCKSAILMEATTGTILYEFNADTPLPPASVTKIMTLLLVMEEIDKGNLNYSDTVTTSSYAASMGGSQIYLKEGEQMSVEDLIKSVVIASANDAAVALAEHICGSEALFVQKMNDKARELGMVNTHFENTNGLDDTTVSHVISAKDIAIMSRELIKHEQILKYSSIWMDTIRNGEFGLTNTNRLVRFYKGATGLKTGSTSKAKFCVSATAKRDNMHLICVVMGAPNSDIRNSIATSLLNWGFSNFELYESQNTEFKPVKVISGVENYCSIHTPKFACVVNKGDSKYINARVNLPNVISAPISMGEEIGIVEYNLNGKIIGKSPILSDMNISKIEFSELFIRILSKFLIK